LFPWKRFVVVFADYNSISPITHLLWHSAAHPLRCLLVFYPACFLRHLVTLLVGLVGAFLVWNLVAVSFRDIDAVLHGDLVTDWVGDLSLMLLLHIFAVLIWVVFAGGPIGHPFLVISSSFPVVLAVLLVGGAALCLCVGLVLRSELIVAFLLVVGGALLLAGGLANLPGGGSALPLVQCLALVHVHGVADVLLGLYIGGVPDCGLLCPAPHRGCRWSTLGLRWSSSVSILGC